MPKLSKPFAGLPRYICVARKVLVYKFLTQGDTMKQLIALIAAAVAVTAFAQAPAAKKEEAKKPADKVEAKAPAVAPAAAPAPAAKEDEKKVEAKKWILVRRPYLVLIDPNLLDDSEVIDYGELGLHRGYSRPRMVQDSDNNDEEVSDHVAVRLWIARLRAMEKFREVTS